MRRIRHLLREGLSGLVGTKARGGLPHVAGIARVHV